jgi:hypothetical protein
VHQLAAHLLAISASRAEQKFHSEPIGRARKEVVGWLGRQAQVHPTSAGEFHFSLFLFEWR